MNCPSPSQQEAQREAQKEAQKTAQNKAQTRAQKRAMDQELAVAERRGAERLRARVRDVLEDRRRVVRLGAQQIEVVEVSAITELLVDDPE